jgi:2-(1,2-epoxy-1,2-dihydrophenyl)acetyl-CoA isomerase
MDYETLTLERDEGIATLTLNRPQSLNAMTARMGTELNDAFARTRDDVEARVLVVTGAGRAFCAGEDVKERPADSAEARQRGTPLGKLARGPLAPIDFAHTFRNMPKPTIAAVNGAAVGQGLSLALACDMRIASENARFGAVWTLRGIPPESAGAFLLTQLVGPAKACELIFGGKIIGADEAKDIGLVNEVVPAAEFREATRSFAREMTAGAPVAIGVSKMMIYQALETNLTVHGRFDFLGQQYCFNTDDREEGIRSFLEKRPAEFKGH